MSAAHAIGDATALREALVRGERSVSETLEETLARIERIDPEVNAYSSVDAAAARARARELDRAREKGEPAGPLFGLPVALKSNLCVEGWPTNCGSKILERYSAPYTATVVRRLLDAGAVLVGMAHMDEFAMGSSGENSAFAATKNPWDLARTPGGSSSGCAAAVAADLAALALGSDTGGSVRLPAALCGISGFKPTYGRVSRAGLVAFGSSLDQVSPLARSARDLERVLAVIAGFDPLDSTSLELPAPEPSTERSLDGVRIGVPEEFLPDELAPSIKKAIEAALAVLAARGARVRRISLPTMRLAIPTYYVIATAEASSNLARFDGVRYGLRVEPQRSSGAGEGALLGMLSATREQGFGEEVKRRILLGTFVLSRGYAEAWYGQALRAREALRAEFRAAFAEVDLVAGPTSPSAAFRLGQHAHDPLALYLTDVLTVPANLTGLPAVSVPCGTIDADGAQLPVGLQLVGPHAADARVLGAARLFQEATDHHLRRPALAA